MKARSKIIGRELEFRCSLSLFYNNVLNGLSTTDIGLLPQELSNPRYVMAIGGFESS